MSSLSDEFQVMLPSKVNNNQRNKPNLYETELAKQLDIPGEWYVALIERLYPQNWTNLDKSYQYVLLRQPIKGVNSKFALKTEKDQTDRYDLISKRAQFRGWEVDRAPHIPRGNYDTRISKILELPVIETQLYLVFINKTINLKIDFHQYRVEINPNKQFAIQYYAERSIMQLLGFGSQSIVQNQLQEIECLNL